MEYVINNNNINHLAFTVMHENKIISTLDTTPYMSWVKSGWNFYFIIKKNDVFGVMESDFPHGKERYEKPANDYISTIISNYKFI